MNQLAMNFFQTTDMAPDALAVAIHAAERQDDAVLALFRQYPAMTPSQCWRQYGSDRAPLTSIRRSISVLTKAGSLVKLDVQVAGVWGRDEHVWRLG